MTLERWAYLVTVVVGVAVLIPVLYHLFQLEWRWRLGAWAGALRSKWATDDLDRPPTEPQRYRRTRSVFDRVVLRPLSRLASPRWEATVWLGDHTSEAYQRANIAEEEEFNKVQTRLATASLRMEKRSRIRRHRGVKCSDCGTRLGSDFICHDAECGRSDGVGDKPHACRLHRRAVFYDAGHNDAETGGKQPPPS